MHKRLNKIQKILLSVTSLILVLSFAFLIYFVKNKNADIPIAIETTMVVTEIETIETESTDVFSIPDMNKYCKFKETQEETEEETESPTIKETIKEEIKEENEKAQENNSQSRYRISKAIQQNQAQEKVEEYRLNYQSLRIKKDTLFSLVLIGASDNIKWKSSDDTIVSLLESESNNATFTGIRTGTAIVYATYKDSTCECTITIY